MVTLGRSTRPRHTNKGLAKKQQGLNIEGIIIEDKINRKAGLPFGEYFNTYRIEPEGYFENIMHHKICVIDLQTTKRR